MAPQPTARIWIGRTFWDDHISRFRDHEDYAQKPTEEVSGNCYYLDLTRKQYDNLVDDLYHYATFDDYADNKRLCDAARRGLASLRKQSTSGRFTASYSA